MICDTWHITVSLRPCLMCVAPARDVLLPTFYLSLLSLSAVSFSSFHAFIFVHYPIKSEVCQSSYRCPRYQLRARTAAISNCKRARLLKGELELAFPNVRVTAHAFVGINHFFQSMQSSEFHLYCNSSSEATNTGHGCWVLVG